MLFGRISPGRAFAWEVTKKIYAQCEIDANVLYSILSTTFRKTKD
jgi:hypothetical protein